MTAPVEEPLSKFIGYLQRLQMSWRNQKKAASVKVFCRCLNCAGEEFTRPSSAHGPCRTEEQARKIETAEAMIVMLGDAIRFAAELRAGGGEREKTVTLPLKAVVEPVLVALAQVAVDANAVLGYGHREDLHTAIAMLREYVPEELPPGMTPDHVCSTASGRCAVCQKETRP